MLRTSFLSLSALLAAGCGTETDGHAEAQEEPPRQATSVVLAPVRVEPVERTVEVVGTLHGDEEVTISAKVPGRVQTIHADVGDRVAAGQPLAQIDPTDYELVVNQRDLAVREALAELGLDEVPGDEFDVTKVATVERARFEAANARAKLDRARRLFEQTPPLISEQDYQDLETAHQVARRSADVAVLEAQTQLAQAKTRRSELEAARQRLSDTSIRAPQGPDVPASLATRPAGRYAVAQRLVSEGEYVREGDPLFRLIADDPIKLRASVPERFVADVRPGQDVRVRVESYPQPFGGAVSRVNPAIDPQSRTFQVEAILPNAQRLLRPGAFARGVIVVGAEPAVTFVPRAAVVSFAGVDRVFTVSDGKAVEHTVSVRAGVERDGHVALSEGLSGQTLVVVRGNTQLTRGSPVEVVDSDDHAATQPSDAGH